MTNTHFSIKKAKEYACNATNGELSLEKAERQLSDFRKLLANSTSEGQSLIYNQEIERIVTWLASPRFKSGKYARGIDDLLLELIEWRAIK